MRLRKMDTPIRKLLIPILISIVGVPLAYPHASQVYLFMGTYEDDPIIRIMTYGEWMEMFANVTKGDYSGDVVHWLEKGRVDLAGRYSFDTRYSTAKVASDVAHSGFRSVALTVPPNPKLYLLTLRSLARYFRNPYATKPGLYRVEAWFYVERGKYPIVCLGMEDHLDWTENHFPNVILDTENGNLGYYDEGYRTGYKVLTDLETKFEHDTWFKLWLTYQTGQKQRYTVGYESSTVSMTFDIDKVWTTYNNKWYKANPAFNFYAGGINTNPRRWEKLYIDDFSVFNITSVP